MKHEKWVEAKYELMKGTCFTCINCGTTTPGGILHCFVHDIVIMNKTGTCDNWMNLDFFKYFNENDNG